MLITESETKCRTSLKGNGIKSKVPAQKLMSFWVDSETPLENINATITLIDSETQVKVFTSADHKNKKMTFFYTLPNSNAKQVIISINVAEDNYRLICDIEKNNEKPTEFDRTIMEITAQLSQDADATRPVFSELKKMDGTEESLAVEGKTNDGVVPAVDASLAVGNINKDQVGTNDMGRQFEST
ncbi:unnamed protein product [Caenorhabditis angaria]|uniref:Uncharacterized protein n=1 Tax=Caenorhabditis angaria TaxID=860376 RepID=A0A9P1ITC7_9PELO|nr:unnamed protein product [Caenorhabditis angaria]